MTASAGPMEGTGRGRHAKPSSFDARALLGPIRSRVDWQQPEDPYDLGLRQPANVGVVLPEAAPAARESVRPAVVAQPLPLRIFTRAIDLLALAVAMMALGQAARSGPLSAAEAARAVRVVAAARPDVGALPGGWPQRVFEAVAAGWVSLTGALQREPSAGLVVREPTVLAAAATLLLLWVLAVRLRLALPTRVALVLGCGAVPLAAGTLAGAARPGVLAALLVVLAAVLISGLQVATARKFAALLLLALALLLVPALVVALAVTFAVLVGQGDLAGKLPRPARRTLSVLLFVLAGALLLAFARGLAPHALSTGPAIAVPPVSALEWVAAGAVLVSVALAVRQRWLRAPAAAVYALLLTALLVPAARGDLVAVGLPLGLLVGLAQLEELVGGVLRRRRGRRTRTFGPTRRAVRHPGSRPAWIAGVLVALLVLGVGGYRLQERVPAPVPVPGAAVVGWFAAEVTGTPVIETDDALWPSLIAAGLPAARLHSPTSSAGPSDLMIGQWLVTTGAPAGWTGYAQFGTVHILRRATRLDPDAVAAAATDGPALAQNPQVHLAAPARAALVAGRVDDRLIAVLANFAGIFTFDIADFPAVTGESATDPTAPPLRQALITAVNGIPVSQPVTAQLLTSWFMRQLGPYQPCGVKPAGSAMLVHYCLADPPD